MHRLMNEKQSIILFCLFPLGVAEMDPSSAIDLKLLRFLLGWADFRTQDACSFQIEMELSTG